MEKNHAKSFFCWEKAAYSKLVRLFISRLSNLINVSFSFFFSPLLFTLHGKRREFSPRYRMRVVDRRRIDASSIEATKKKKKEKNAFTYTRLLSVLALVVLRFLYFTFARFRGLCFYHHSFTYRPPAPYPLPPYCSPRFKFLIRHFETVPRKIESFFLSTGINLDANIFKVYTGIIVENTLLRVRTRLHSKWPWLKE